MAEPTLKPFSGNLDPTSDGGLIPFTGSLDGEGSTASDLAKSLKVGAQRLPGMVTGLADLPVALATGARPFTKAADALGEATGFQPGKWADETKFSAGYEQGKKAVDEAWKDGSAGDIALAYLKNPGYTANQVVESVPGMVAGGLAGRALMGVGRVAAPAARAGGVGPAVPGLAERVLGQWAAPVAAGVGEGAVTAGQQMAQYQGDDQQTNALASLGAGVGTGLIGVGAGRVANRLGLETAETAIAKAGTGVAKAADEVPLSAKRRILGGMVSEAVLQELPQSSQEQMWQNWADGKPLMEGVIRAATEGAIAGGVMGAGANMSDGGAGKRRALAERQASLLAEAEALQAQQAQDEQHAATMRTAQDAAMARAGTLEAEESATPVADDGGAGLQEQHAVAQRLRDQAQQASRAVASPDDEIYQSTGADAATVAPVPAEPDQRTPSQRMGIDPGAGPLSKVAAAAVDAGAAQEAQFLGATGRDLQVRSTGPGVADESNVIDVQGRVVEDRAIGTPRRIETRQRLGATQAAPLSTAVAQPQSIPNAPANGDAANHVPALSQQALVAMDNVAQIPPNLSNGVPNGSQADQAQQAATQPSQAGTAPAGQPAAQGLTDAAPTQNDGAPRTAAPAQAGQAQAATKSVAARPDGWRKSMLKAGPAAKAMGIDPKGKRLAQVVAEIDAADSERNQGAALDTRAPKAIESGANATRAAVRNVRGEWAPAVRTAIGSRVIRGAPTFQDAGTAAHWAELEQRKDQEGADVESLVRQQSLLESPPSSAKGTPVTRAGDIARGLRDQIDNVAAQEKRPGMYRQEAQRLRQATQGMEGAGEVRGTFADAADMLEAWAGQPAASVAPQGREVSREIGRYKEGLSEFRANQVRAELARKSPEVVYTVEEDTGLKNGFVVVGRKPAPGAKLGVEKLKASKGRAPIQFSRGMHSPQEFVHNADGGLDYGEITPEMGRIMRREAAAIRLREGDAAFGLRHIDRGERLRQLQSAGYATATDFVEDVARHFDAVHKGRGASLFLVKNTATPNRTLVVQLEAGEGGSYYDVKTALVSRPDFMRGKEMLWERAQTNRANEGIPSAISGQSGASVPPSSESAKFSQAMSPELARALLAIRRPATKESVRAAVRELVNGMGMLPNRLGRVVVATAAEIQQDWEPLIGPMQLHSEEQGQQGVAGKAQGFYDPNSRTVFLIADHIRQGDELGVVAHELMHKHGPAVLGEEGWSRLHGAIEGWASAPEGSQERQVYDEAAARVRQSRPEGAAERDYSSQELFPYAVQVALEQGVRPNLLAKPGTVARWLGQVKAALREVWTKIVGKPESFNSQDLVNLAFGIAQRENPEHAGELDGVAGQAQPAPSPEGQQFSRSAMKSVEANIARGQEAMNRAILEKADQRRAMHRSDLGWVDFVWGDDKKGIRHILKQRQDKDGMTLHEAMRLVTDGLVQTIAKGTTVRRVAVSGSIVLHVDHDGLRAILVKNPGSNAWMLTGFEMNVPGGNREGFDSQKPTQTAPTPTRGGLGADTASSVADNGSRMQTGQKLQFSRAATPTAGDYTPAQQRAAEHAFGVQKQQTLTERAQAFRANLGTRLRQGLVDQFAPIKEVSPHAYMLARMSKGSDAAVEAALLYGKPFLRDGVADVNIQDGGFAQVLAGLKGEHDRFFQWVAAQRAERLKAEGKENLLTDQDITALRSLNAGKMADGTVRMPVYAAALRELNAFNEASLKVALESGLIDQAAYDLMKDQPYVPFYRLMEEGDMRGPRFSSGLVNQQAWKKLKGGKEQINADLLQNTLMNWSHLYAAAARNRASLATMAEAEKLGIAYQVPADTKGAVKVMRDGAAEHWAVEDPYLLEAISALNYTPGGIVKALAPFKRLLTFGVTVNPTFKIRNLIRDSLSAIAQSDLSYNPLENVANGWKATRKDSQTYASMLASGGIIKFGTQEDTSRLRGQIERLGGTMLDQQGWDKLKGQMRSLWEAYEEFGDRTENVNRTALYERLIAKGNSHAEASFMARDLMDFSMSGKWETVRFLAQTVPFLNARLQGLYKLGRAANEDPRRFAAMAGAVSLASLGLLAAYGDDDDWKKREDWDRDNFWWFKVGGMAFRIPKPFEVGAIGTVAERTAELMMSEEMTGKRFGQRISDMVFNTFAMDPTPQAIKPFLDVYANKDSFSGRAIEGMADERLRPQDRYNERTSEVARLLGSWGLPDPVRLAKGEYSGLSPKQVDFLLRGYFGWMATVATTVTDAAARPMLDRGERPAMRLRDTFLAGNFVETLPTGSSRYVSTMYEQAKEVEQAWASYQAAVKSGDMEKASEIQQDEAPKLRNRMAVENAKRQIAELGQQAKRIESNRLMPAEEKRRRLDEIEARKHEAARRVAPTS